MDSNWTVFINKVVTYDGVNLGSITAHVVESLPLGVDIVLGFDLLSRSMFQITPKNGQPQKEFRRIRRDAICQKNPARKGKIVENIDIEDEDFSAKFNGEFWTIEWRWKGVGQKAKSRKFYNGHVKNQDRQLFDNEVSDWIKQGILIEHKEQKHGKVKFFLPMLAVRQVKGESVKVRPVLDYREFNCYIESHPGGATPICNERLRKWRQMGSNCSILDLKKAYLQVRVHPSLYVYQGIKWRGKVYLLTRLGFGLSSAPKIMTAIVEKVLSLDSDYDGTVSSYIDDILVNTEVVSVNAVRKHLKKFGLEAKDPTHFGATAGARVLGLNVLPDMSWKRDGALPNLHGNLMTRREVHGILGEWVGHYPVASWIRIASAFIQRCTAQECGGWDEKVNDDIMLKLYNINEKLKNEGHPVRGKWPVNVNKPVVIWADASSIALGVALEVDGDVIEDASWLRPKHDSAHINRAELDAVIRGLSMTIKWGF